MIASVDLHVQCISGRQPETLRLQRDCVYDTGHFVLKDNKDTGVSSTGKWCITHTMFNQLLHVKHGFEWWCQNSHRWWYLLIFHHDWPTLNADHWRFNLLCKCNIELKQALVHKHWNWFTYKPSLFKYSVIYLKQPSI